MFKWLHVAPLNTKTFRRLNFTAASTLDFTSPVKRCACWIETSGCCSSRLSLPYIQFSYSSTSLPYRLKSKFAWWNVKQNMVCFKLSPCCVESRDTGPKWRSSRDSWRLQIVPGSSQRAVLIYDGLTCSSSLQPTFRNSSQAPPAAIVKKKHGVNTDDATLYST